MIPIPSTQTLLQTAADIPQRSYVPVKDFQKGMDTTRTVECARCHKRLVEKDIVKQPKCGHLFHAHCIDSHLRTNIFCPVCHVQLLLPPVTAGPVYPLDQLPPRAIPVATVFVPAEGTDTRDYGTCRECGANVLPGPDQGPPRDQCMVPLSTLRTDRHCSLYSRQLQSAVNMLVVTFAVIAIAVALFDG